MWRDGQGLCHINLHILAFQAFFNKLKRSKEEHDTYFEEISWSDQHIVNVSLEVEYYHVASRGGDDSILIMYKLVWNTYQ